MDFILQLDLYNNIKSIKMDSAAYIFKGVQKVCRDLKSISIGEYRNIYQYQVLFFVHIINLAVEH